MAPEADQWRRAIGPATKAILAAHLFGGRVDMEPILDLARRRHLLVIEDCAQAFAGDSYRGHPEADAGMFSFGVIKASTALGGAVLQVRDADVLERMRRLQATWPVQERGAYFRRLVKYAVVKLLASRVICGTIARTCRALGCDYDRWINRTARGFPGPDLFAQIRREPCAALLAVLARRLRRYDAARWRRHAEKGSSLARRLEGSVSCPGTAASPHTHWVFPVVVENPRDLMEHLARAGFDATQGQSLCVVPPPADRPALAARTAEQLLAGVVFLPFYPELPPAESQRMAAVVTAACSAPR
jgi:dTDP-4-amino-4,6-dideoxygalactose transaminase